MNALTTKPLIAVEVDHLSFLQTAADHFRMKGCETFTAATTLELLRIDDFNARKIGDSTIFTELEVVAKKLHLQPDGTFGGLTRTTGFSQEDAHKIGCACLGAEVTGEEIAQRLDARIAELT
ncbi:MAG: hypothetical protein RLZZ76_474 [Candidatus Parcubacteria bacterium]|jgi:hypothetical protein